MRYLRCSWCRVTVSCVKEGVAGIIVGQIRLVPCGVSVVERPRHGLHLERLPALTAELENRVFSWLDICDNVAGRTGRVRINGEIAGVNETGFGPLAELQVNVVFVDVIGKVTAFGKCVRSAHVPLRSFRVAEIVHAWPELRGVSAEGREDIHGIRLDWIGRVIGDFHARGIKSIVNENRIGERGVVGATVGAVADCEVSGEIGLNDIVHLLEDAHDLRVGEREVVVVGGGYAEFGELLGEIAGVLGIQE